MRREHLRDLLEQVQAGKVPVEDALDRLRGLPYEELGFAKLDHHRSLRKGYPEAVLCRGKTVEQVVRIVESFVRAGDTVLATKASPEMFAAVQQVCEQARYHPLAGIIMAGQGRPVTGRGTVLVLTAGTADIGIAEEAALTAEVMGNHVERAFDVGVAGLHRLLDQKEKLFEATVIIAVAGMEGALPSLVSGLVSVPVIAVPTSVGYGASFQGLAALLGMLNTCAPGVAVVNIDNGFGAGYLASMINQQVGVEEPLLREEA